MSLSGNLGFVSLDEVLRLLTRSNQQGSVDVRGQDVHGRIFINKGEIELATTSDDAGLRRHLVKAGIVDETAVPGIESGDMSLTGAAEDRGDQLVELLREMTVESLYQMDLKGDAFEVHEGSATPFGSPHPFDLEGLLDDSKQRVNDWADVSALISDLHSPMSLVRDLGERDDITIDSDSWRVISEVRSGSSVADIADQLGTTEFWTARVASKLVDKNLVWMVIPETREETYDESMADEWHANDPGAVVDSVDDSDPNESWWQEPDPVESDQPEADVVESEHVQHDYVMEEEQVSEDAPTDDFMPAVGDVDQYEEQPVDEPVAESFTEPAGEPVEAAAAEEFSQIPTLQTTADNAEVEEDTEAFLEKVFSELESPEEQQPQPEEGYGLLRRRRMGAMRDGSNDS